MEQIEASAQEICYELCTLLPGSVHRQSTHNQLCVRSTQVQRPRQGCPAPAALYCDRDEHGAVRPDRQPPLQQEMGMRRETLEFSERLSAHAPYTVGVAKRGHAKRGHVGRHKAQRHTANGPAPALPRWSEVARWPAARRQQCR